MVGYSPHEPVLASRVFSAVLCFVMPTRQQSNFCLGSKGPPIRGKEAFQQLLCVTREQNVVVLKGDFDTSSSLFFPLEMAGSIFS